MEKADGMNVKLIPMLGLNERWILNGTPGELGECFAPFECPLSLHLEAALPRHGRVPDVVRSEERGIERDVRRCRETVLGGVVRGHVDHGVNVGLD